MAGCGGEEKRREEERREEERSGEERRGDKSREEVGIGGIRVDMDGRNGGLREWEWRREAGSGNLESESLATWFGCRSRSVFRLKIAAAAALITHAQVGARAP